MTKEPLFKVGNSLKLNINGIYGLCYVDTDEIIHLSSNIDNAKLVKGIESTVNESIKDTLRKAYTMKLVEFNEKKKLTTVVWEDGSITQVRMAEGDTFDKETAIAYAVAKKLFESCDNSFLKTAREMIRAADEREELKKKKAAKKELAKKKITAKKINTIEGSRDESVFDPVNITLGTINISIDDILKSEKSNKKIVKPKKV